MLPLLANSVEAVAGGGGRTFVESTSHLESSGYEGEPHKSFTLVMWSNESANVAKGGICQTEHHGRLLMAHRHDAFVHMSYIRRYCMSE